jgi:hypothetical protein
VFILNNLPHTITFNARSTTLHAAEAQAGYAKNYRLIFEKESHEFARLVRLTGSCHSIGGGQHDETPDGEKCSG